MTGEETKALKEKFETEFYSVPFDVSEVEKYKENLWQFIQSEIVTPYEKQLEQVEREMFAGDVDKAIQATREEIVEEIKNFIIGKTTGPTLNGGYKYWSEEAFEEYFEDRGYKMGPQRFIDDMVNSIKHKRKE